MRWRPWILWVVLALSFGVSGVGIAQVDDAPSLAGVIDIHAHAASQTGALNFQRQFDAIQAAQIAKIYGMRGIVLKEHTTETASWAYLVSQVVPGVEVFGGIVLNRYVGGMNPAAVEAMIGTMTATMTAASMSSMAFLVAAAAQSPSEISARRALTRSRGSSANTFLSRSTTRTSAHNDAVRASTGPSAWMAAVSRCRASVSTGGSIPCGDG